MNKKYLIAGGVVAAVVAVAYLVHKASTTSAASIGASLGGAVVDMGVGVVTGAAHTVADTANDPNINPLQPFGEWLGGKVYDLTH